MDVIRTCKHCGNEFYDLYRVCCYPKCAREFPKCDTDVTQTREGSTRYWTPKQFIGKTVFDHKGRDCGKVQSLQIDPQTFVISGVMTKKRLAKEYFISQGYFDEIKESGLYLNSVPIKPNDKVMDIEGKNLGKAVKINLDPETNKPRITGGKVRLQIQNSIFL